MAREIVEQVVKSSKSNGLWKYEIVSDYGDNPEVSEIADELRRIWIPVEGHKNPFVVTIGWKRRTILVKAVSHLGRPHPEHKKRIQIPGTWQGYLQDPDTLLLGAYRYKSEYLFVSFGTEKYAHNRLNNSSAHVYSMDLLHGAEDGRFEKIDAKGNRIVVVNAENLLGMLTWGIQTVEAETEKPAEIIWDFTSTIESVWNGIDCYREMHEKSFSQKNQAEWPGFYLEYRFESYLEANPDDKEVVRFVREKAKDSIDLDLVFLKGKFLWDLKCHSDHSGAILGNDFKDFEKALEKHKRVWYVVLSHETERDQDHGYEVTRVWYDLKGKVSEDVESGYWKKMKHSIRPLRMDILEITPFNKRYIKEFNQGKNSNGKDREKKIKIESRDMGNFLIKSFQIAR